MGNVGGCSGGTVTASFDVSVSPAGTTWSLDDSQAVADAPSGVTVTANGGGGGSGSFTVAVTAAPQQPTSGFTCSDTYSLLFYAPVNVNVTFPDGSGDTLQVSPSYNYIGVN